MKKVSIVALQHPDFPNLFLHGIRQDSGKYNLIGGHAEPGETTIETARRETQEEAGLEIKDLNEVANGEFPGEDDTLRVTLFVGIYPGTTINIHEDPDKEFTPGSFKFIDIDKFKDKLHVPARRNLLAKWLKSKEKGTELAKAPQSFKPTPKNPFREVIRMQNAAGHGPYNGVDSGDWLDPNKDEFNPEFDKEKQQSENPAPFEDSGFNTEDAVAIAGRTGKFGFENKEQLKRWFSPTEIAKLANLGFKPTKVKAAKVWSSGKQAFFEKYGNKPIKKAEPVEPTIKVTMGAGKLRKVRDLAESHADKRVHIKELRTAGIDPSIVSSILEPPTSDPADRGKSTHAHVDKINKLIDGLPKREYTYSLGRFNGQQRHSDANQYLLTIKTPKTMKESLKGEGADAYHSGMLDIAKKSGHPHEDGALGWARFTVGKDGNFHVDEVQSDLVESGLDKVKAQAKWATQEGKIPDAYIQAAIDAGSIDEDQAANLRALSGDKLKDMLGSSVSRVEGMPIGDEDAHKKLLATAFGEHHPNEAIHEALLEYFRQDPRNHGKKVEFWHHEPKAELAAMEGEPPIHMQETYADQPRKLGYKPSTYGSIDTQDNDHWRGRKTWQMILNKG